jgi:hypothetical protein
MADDRPDAPADADQTEAEAAAQTADIGLTLADNGESPDGPE